MLHNFARAAFSFSAAVEFFTCTVFFTLHSKGKLPFTDPKSKGKSPFPDPKNKGKLHFTAAKRKKK